MSSILTGSTISPDHEPAVAFARPGVSLGLVRAADPEARATLVAALVACGDGDRDAFRTVYRLTSAKLFGICLRICNDRSAAEDVLSETYLTIWRRADGFDPARASPITWLATIARNRAIDWRRSNPVRATAVVDAIADLPDPALPADAGLLAAEDGRRLDQCLGRLDERQRVAIRRAFFDGLTYAELATRAAVPLGTMKSWVRRGLLGLRECLDADA